MPGCRNALARRAALLPACGFHWAGSGMATTTESAQAVDTGPDLPRHATPTFDVAICAASTLDRSPFWR